MNFKQIYNDGVAARRAGKTVLDNPFYGTENLPIDTASAYRAWQIKAEAWEQGWCADADLTMSRSIPALQGRRSA